MCTIFSGLDRKPDKTCVMKQIKHHVHICLCKYEYCHNNNNNNFITLRSHECGINEKYTDI